MRCILVDAGTGEIINFIEADPSVDIAPEGQLLLVATDDSPVNRDHVLVQGRWQMTPEAAQILAEEEYRIREEAWSDD